MSDGGWKVDREFLSCTPIFGGLPPEVLDRLIGAANVVEVASGAQLIGEGEVARHIFIVCQGELEILKRGARGAEVRLAVLRAGDCVGEMPLIDIQPRSATVRALSPAVLFRLDHVEIAKLRQADAEIWTLLVLNIAREISRRLRRADQVLAEMGVVAQEMWSNEGRATGSVRIPEQVPAPTTAH